MSLLLCLGPDYGGRASGYALTGSQEEPGNRCHSCSASAQTMEAEPPDMRYQALPGNEYNHLGLL